MQTYSKEPTDYDIWRAALLYVGLYGNEALEHAHCQCSLEHDLDNVVTWERILSKISEILEPTAPDRTLQ